jgi:phage protein D
MHADRHAIHSARPTFAVAGRDEPRLSAALLRLLVTETAEGLAACEAEFANWGQSPGGGTGFLWFDRQTLDFGRDLAVRLGDATLFEGRISALEARFPAQSPPVLAVRAEDRLQDLRMTRRTRLFERTSDADLVRRLAADHGLQPDVDLPGPTHALLVQANESDLALLRRRALAADADLRLQGTRLQVRQRSARGGGAAPPVLQHGARLHAFDASADLAHQRTAVTCGGWDVAGKQALAARATASDLGAEADNDGNGDSGPAMLQRAFGERADAFGHGVPLDDEAARALAQAHLRTLARRFLRGRGQCDPEPALVVGGRVELRGLGPLFSGTWGLTEVVHRFDMALGLRTAFAVERAWIGRP